MIIEMVVTDLATIVGYNFILFFVLMFGILLFMVSRAVGVTSLLVAAFLTVYVFVNNSVNSQYLITDAFLVVATVLLGLFMGFMFYMVFLRD